MRLSHHLAHQLARPHGAVGQWVGRAMDLANRRPTQLALDLLDGRPGEAVVDAGCGTGAALAALKDQVGALRLAGFDPSPAMIDAARRRLPDSVRLVEATVADHPYDAASFDAVLALNMLYFCDAEGQMLADLRRLLKPGGRLVAYVTEKQSMHGWGLVGAGLHRLWTANSLKEGLVAAGFAPEAISVHQTAITRKVTGLLVKAMNG